MLDIDGSPLEIETPSQFEARRATGRLGELEVELQLVKRGWHAVRLDTSQMAANSDLLAINRHKRLAIQVKTTDADRAHSHRHALSFGYSTAYVREKKPIFNSKESPLIADIVVGVSYSQLRSRFVVLPVALAEVLCRRHVDYWHSIGTRTTSGQRSDSFPIYLCFTKHPKVHVEHYACMMRNVAAYEGKWHILDEPVEKLHDTAAWPLL